MPTKLADELAEEMAEAVIAQASDDFGAIDHEQASRLVDAVLALVHRDYRLDPYCNAELMPEVICKKPATSSPRHKHEAKLPSTGNLVEWT